MKSLHVNANEIHFPCPNCGQKLACEDGYGGWRIQCPNCQGGVVVPLLSVPRRMATVKLPGAAGPGAASPSQAAAQDNSAQAFIERFLAGAAPVFGGLATMAVGMLALFGLLAGACGACNARQVWSTTFIPIEVFIGVGLLLMVFSRVWNRLWD